MEDRQIGGSNDSIPTELGCQACVGMGHCRHQIGEMCQAGVGHKQVCGHHTQMCVVWQMID